MFSIGSGLFYQYRPDYIAEDPAFMFMLFAGRDEYAVAGAEDDGLLVKVDFHLPFQNHADVTVAAPIGLDEFVGELHQAQSPTGFLDRFASDAGRRCLPRD